MRRSVLYIPAANSRALDKARTLACDGIIFDLEDAVAVSAKQSARAQLVEALDRGGYGNRERIVRVNALNTEWCGDDIAAMVSLDIHGILFPKINSATDVKQALDLVDSAGATELVLWAMLETPQAVLNASTIISASSRLAVAVMGTSDLMAELRGQHSAERSELMYALQHCLLAARAGGCEILDGVHLDFKDLDGFEKLCVQARQMGFDGKTLIHPTQISLANKVFAFSDAEVQHAKDVLAAWEQAAKADLGVVVVNGKLIENLHVKEAERVIEIDSLINA